MVPAVTIVGEFLATFKEYPPSQASGALSAIGIGPQVAARMWQVAAFIDARVVKPIVIGGDDLTRDFNVVDAASFSSAIPGVLLGPRREAR